MRHVPHPPGTAEADRPRQPPSGEHGNDGDAEAFLRGLLVSVVGSAGSSRLRERELEALAALVPPRRFHPGERVLGRGDAVKHLALIHSGRVGLVGQAAGRRVILSVLGAGDVLGETPVLLGIPALWEAVALVDATVLEIPARLFKPALEGESALALEWTAGASARLAAAWDRLEELLAGDLRSQVASLLLHERVGANVFLTQQVIADMLAARRTSVTRVLGDLQRRDLIAAGYARISLLDRDGLAALASAGPGRDVRPARRAPETGMPSRLDRTPKPGAAA